MHLFLDEVKRPLPCQHQTWYVTDITQKCILWQLLSHIKTHRVQCWLPGFTRFPHEYTCLTASLQTHERLHQHGACDSASLPCWIPGSTANANAASREVLFGFSNPVPSAVGPVASANVAA